MFFVARLSFTVPAPEAEASPPVVPRRARPSLECASSRRTESRWHQTGPSTPTPTGAKAGRTSPPLFPSIRRVRAPCFGEEGLRSGTGLEAEPVDRLSHQDGWQRPRDAEVGPLQRAAVDGGDHNGPGGGGSAWGE